MKSKVDDLRTFGIGYDGEEVPMFSYNTGIRQPCQGQYCDADEAISIIKELEKQIEELRKD